MIAHRKTARPGEAERFENEKIIVSRMGKSIVATYDKGGLYVKDAMLLVKDGSLSLKYILGLLNSKLINYYYKEFFVTIDVLKNALLSIPIKKIDEKNKNEKELHDEIIKHVNTMLELNKQKQTTTNSETLEQLNQRIAYTDDKINKLVYELYGLTYEEIRIVEGNG